MMLALMILALLSSFGGCALLALSQARHWQSVTQSPGVPPRALRVAGRGLLLASLAICIARDGLSFAALLWPMLAMAGALGVAALLAWRPNALSKVARLWSAEANK
jgi:hypothetical protein